MLTVKDAAAKSGIPVRTIQYHLKQGNLKGTKVGRDYLIGLAALERFLDNPPVRGPKPTKKKRLEPAKDLS